jgi:hypothetical protein
MSGTFFKKHSPVKPIDTPFFRRLGFYIWDHDRLAALELLNHGQGRAALHSDILLSQHNLWFTWESLLSREEIESQERKRINQFPETARAFGSRERRHIGSIDTCNFPSKDILCLAWQAQRIWNCFLEEYEAR